MPISFLLSPGLGTQQARGLLLSPAGIFLRRGSAWHRSPPFCQEGAAREWGKADLVLQIYQASQSFGALKRMPTQWET